jgi:Flp pilus assembly protein TadG
MYRSLENRLGNERGAVQIKTVLIVTFLLVTVFTLIKVVPVYIEQQEVAHDTDELARKAAMGLSVYNADKIKAELDKLTRDYNLPEGSLALVSRGDNTAQITVKYTRSIDFVVTNYAWNVDYTASGKGL